MQTGATRPRKQTNDTVKIYREIAGRCYLPKMQEGATRPRKQTNGTVKLYREIADRCYLPAKAN
ncbi:hypothetical protein FACS1894132_01470 [Clostridia bacterium]|nr:hypothetical protein FACS1894132_01470 [Clostridia bacterium]